MKTKFKLWDAFKLVLGIAYLSFTAYLFEGNILNIGIRIIVGLVLIIATIYLIIPVLEKF